jgi:hypothetical protein
LAVVQEEEGGLLRSVVAWRSKGGFVEGCEGRHGGDGLGGCCLVDAELGVHSI